MVDAKLVLTDELMKRGAEEARRPLRYEIDSLDTKRG
jgi:hypothetical protein